MSSCNLILSSGRRRAGGLLAARAPAEMVLANCRFSNTTVELLAFGGHRLMLSSSELTHRCTQPRLAHRPPQQCAAGRASQQLPAAVFNTILLPSALMQDPSVLPIYAQ